jgi:hypothetical protein
LKSKHLNVPNNTLTLSADRLTLVTHASSTTGLTLSNDRSLELNAQSDSAHLVQLDGTLSSVFAGISWISSIAADWADQIFDGALNPWALVVTGSLDISLPPSTSSEEYGLTVRGGLRSWTGNIRLTADEMDFLGGSSTVIAAGIAESACHVARLDISTGNLRRNRWRRRRRSGSCPEDARSPQPATSRHSQMGFLI